MLGRILVLALRWLKGSEHRCNATLLIRDFVSSKTHQVVVIQAQIAQDRGVKSSVISRINKVAVTVVCGLGILFRFKPGQ